MRGVIQERYEALRSGLSSSFQDLVVVGRHLSEASAILGKICRKYDLLLIAYTACLAAIVLTNDRNAPRSIYFIAVLPVAIFVGLAFARRVITTSIVFWAVAVYLLAMGLGSLTATDIPPNDLSRHFRLIPLVLSYLMVIGFFATDPKSLKRLLLVSGVLVAASALLNLVSYHAIWGCPPIVSPWRLCAVLGMPDYINSTNISAPYALYAVGALAALVHSDLLRVERALFAASAAILLVALAFTEARSGLLAAMLGFAVSAATGPRWCRLALGALAAVIIVALAASPFLQDILFSRGLSYRPELWSLFLFMGLEQPFLGHGILDNIDQRMRDGTLIDQPHNLVLSAFVRGGIVGAVAMATAIGGAVYWAARYCFKTRNVIPLALIATMVGYGMVDYQLLVTYPTWPWITFWFPLGICVGVETLMRSPEPHEAVPKLSA